MSNITFETSSFSEQLGIYDFFSVIISGAIFLFGLSIVNVKVRQILWRDFGALEWIGVFLLIYIIGLVLQEIASYLDHKYFKIYTGMNRRILKGEDKDKCTQCREVCTGCQNCAKFDTNEIVKNPLLLKRYRILSDELLEYLELDDKVEHFEKECVNGFVFSSCQYYVAINGKDKKVEKMRALFSMSKTLTLCFAGLALYMILAILCGWNIPSDTTVFMGVSQDICQFIFFIIFAGLTRIFFYRSKKVMERFLLILLGTYDAIKRTEKINKKK